MFFTEIIEICRQQYKSLILIMVIPLIASLIISFLLHNQYTTSATLSPKRSGGGESSSGVGVMAAFAGIEDEKLSPELKFATNYFYSNKFLSEFLIEHDLIDDILMYKKYQARTQKDVLYKKSDKFEVKNLFDENDPQKGMYELQQAIKEFKKMLQMIPSRADPSLASLEVTHYSPALSYFIATEILYKLDREIAALDIKSADSQIEYINSIIGDYSSIETTKILASILDREFTKKILANSSDQYAFLILDPPVFPIEKSEPRRSIIVVLFFLFGLFVNSLFLGFHYLKQNNLLDLKAPSS